MVYESSRRGMSLPTVRRVCACLPLQAGCVLLTLLSMMLCTADIVAGASKLPYHRERMPEDNLISMSMVMFSTFSLVCNVFILLGIWLRRPGYVQFAQLFNSLFMVFLLLVGAVTAGFSPELAPALRSPPFLAIVILAYLCGAVFCFYYMAVVNSVYHKMKLEHSDSAIPV